MLKNSSTIQNTWLNRISHRTSALIWGGGERVQRYFSLDKQNEMLAQENFVLTQKVLEYESLLGERAAAESTEAFAGAGHFEMIPARLIRLSRNSQQNYLAIDKGSADGIKPYSGVITSNGVVGIISAVDRHHAYGLSFMNTNFNLSARIGRNGMVAPLGWRGTGTDKAIIRNLALHNAVAPGDTVWTSGFSDFFPAGIPLGVTEESVRTFGATVEVNVRLFQDFSCLEYVTVVRGINQEETNTPEL